MAFTKEQPVCYLVDEECTRVQLIASHKVTFDTDSYEIVVDGGASRCATNDKSHFIGTMRPPGRFNKLKGIDGSLSIKGIGTIEWEILDDEGQRHVFRIHDVLYVPALPKCLLSPQHWAKGNRFRKLSNKFSAIIDDCSTMLRWNGTTLNITHHPSLNIPICHSAPSIHHYRAKLAEHEEEHHENNPETHPLAYSTSGVFNQPLAFVGIPDPTAYDTFGSNQPYSSTDTSESNLQSYSENELQSLERQAGQQADSVADKPIQETANKDSGEDKNDPEAINWDEIQDKVLEENEAVKDKHLDQMTPQN